MSDDLSTDERVGRWRRSTWQGPLTILANLWLGLYRDDGSEYMTRWEYLSWVWRVFYRKWWRGPLRCKLGKHRISRGSDTGIGGCAMCTPGTIDVWCDDCDMALEVPIDDVVGWPHADGVLDLWRGAQEGADDER